MEIWFQIEGVSNKYCQLNPGNLPNSNEKEKKENQMDYFANSEERSDVLR